MTEPQALTRAEGRVLFDEAAQRYMGMSGDEFLRRWDAGEYDEPKYDTLEDINVMRMYFLIPFAR